MLTKRVHLVVASVLLTITSGAATAQWLVTPPLDRPQDERRSTVPFEDRAPAQVPGIYIAPQVGPQDDSASQQQNGGCPYVPRKLDLMV